MESREEVGIGVYIICGTLGDTFEKWGDWWDIVEDDKEDGVDNVWDILVVEDDVCD